MANVWTDFWGPLLRGDWEEFRKKNIEEPFRAGKKVGDVASGAYGFDITVYGIAILLVVIGLVGLVLSSGGPTVLRLVRK